MLALILLIVLAVAGVIVFRAAGKKQAEKAAADKAAQQSKQVTDALDSIDKTVKSSASVAANPVENKVPQLNPVEKTNPFKYTNPFK